MRKSKQLKQVRKLLEKAIKKKKGIKNETKRYLDLKTEIDNRRTKKLAPKGVK